MIYSSCIIRPLWIVFDNNLNLGVNTFLHIGRQDNVITVCMYRPSSFFIICVAHRPIYVDSQKWACIIGYITHNMINEEKSICRVYCCTTCVAHIFTADNTIKRHFHPNVP